MKISQEEFADKIGMHRTYYSQIERGKKDIRMSTFEKVCDGFGVPIGDVARDVDR